MFICCISQFKDNARETQHSIHISFLDCHAVLWALCVQGIFGAVNIQAPYVDSSWCLSLGALSCCLQDLLLAAVSMDAFPHQTHADSGCAAFSCLQAVLENSLAPSSEITWAVTDSFPGYHCAVSQDVGAQLGLTSRFPCLPQPSGDPGVFAWRTGVSLVPPACSECL